MVRYSCDSKGFWATKIQPTLLIVGITLLFSSSDLAAAVLQKVVSGTATIGSSEETITVTGFFVDSDKSFLVFSLRLDDNAPRSSQVTGQLTSNTTLVFERAISGVTVTIEYSIAEFASGVTVQRGTAIFSSATATVSLSPGVDTSKSFPLVVCEPTVLYSTTMTSYGPRSSTREPIWS